ncbi:hypothetical protein BRARA_I01760 [Brassica rapa]|uniref:RNase H type-1 domain-containing protein n=1 Tax=Brassica campestris TaxID=3711 RepID=A0A397XUL9_BRACM|nr:hypothetical protein BRARA_I01760 [Brassica rapa]CAG7861698.1 unnamed protein product [Brassica rapa]VDC60007.1 unnamed protein product [Brassica rapa]
MPLIRIEPYPRCPRLISIFTDAAWNSSTGEAWLGWIIDDSVSTSQHATKATLVSLPLMAETLAVHSAITFSVSRGLDSISILSDFQTLMNTINKKELKLEIFGVLNDVYYLATAFKSIAFKFIPRSENVRADTMVKQALWASNLP